MTLSSGIGIGDFHKMHVITMVSNHLRFESRYRLYRQFAAHMARSGIQLWTCEVAHGDRPFVVTERDNPYHLQLRTSTELWHKERALNLLVNHLSDRNPDWGYVVWADCDIEFPRWCGDDSWLRETWHALQHHKVVQCFQNAIDLGPDGQALHTHTGFAYSYVTGRPFKRGYINWHPGFCWGMRRETYESTAFIDHGILGSGDRHMACGWIGRVDESFNRHVTAGYRHRLERWQEQAERFVRRDMGFVPGVLLHHFHGRKVDRRYASRWKILVETKFNPDTDMKPDGYGLWQWADHGDERSLLLRDEVRAYFKGRREDSTDLEAP